MRDLFLKLGLQFGSRGFLKIAKITKTSLIFVLGNTLENFLECRSHLLTAFLHSELYYNNTTQNYAVLRAHLVWRFPKIDFV